MAWQFYPPTKSCACNPETLQFYRRQKNWTQVDLAEAAGYSERLVRKAEGGRPISVTTIADLAEALSSTQHPLHPEDLILKPIEIVQELIFGSYRYREQTFEKILPHLHPDVVLIFTGDPQQIPFAGEHRGHAGVQRALDLFFQALEAPEDCDYVNSHHFVVNERNRQEVIVWGKSYFHAKGQPHPPIELQVRVVFERGKIILIDDRFDTASAIQQLRPTP